jgi:hypothetical protein
LQISLNKGNAVQPTPQRAEKKRRATVLYIRLY